MFSDKSSFLTSLSNLISQESKSLTSDFCDILKKAGLEDVTKKITFAEDAKGNIVIEGNISARQKNRLAKLVNGDSELVERIKTQKARMEIAGELEKEKPNLSDKKFNAARTQILKDYLNKNDFSLDQIKLEDHESGLKNFVLRDTDGNKKDGTAFNDLMNSFPELGREIVAYTERENATPIQKNASPEIGAVTKEKGSNAVRSLLSIKRGVLSEGSDAEPDFKSQIQSLKENVSDKIVAVINEMFADNEDMQIRDFNIRVDSTGKVDITNVRTKGNDPDANAAVKKMMNSYLDTELRDEANAVGSAILDDHDDKHGDVAEYKHDVIIGSAHNAGYKIESKEADEAAMREIMDLTSDIGSLLGGFFAETLNIKNSFSLVFSSEGLQLADADALSARETVSVHGHFV